MALKHDDDGSGVLEMDELLAILMHSNGRAKGMSERCACFHRALRQGRGRQHRCQGVCGTIAIPPGQGWRCQEDGAGNPEARSKELARDRCTARRAEGETKTGKYRQT